MNDKINQNLPIKDNCSRLASNDLFGGASDYTRQNKTMLFPEMTEPKKETISYVEKYKIPVFGVIGEMRSKLNDAAPKLGRVKFEALYELTSKLESEIDAILDAAK